MQYLNSAVGRLAIGVAFGLVLFLWRRSTGKDFNLRQEILALVIPAAAVGAASLTSGASIGESLAAALTVLAVPLGITGRLPGAVSPTEPPEAKK